MNLNEHNEVFKEQSKPGYERTPHGAGIYPRGLAYLAEAICSPKRQAIVYAPALFRGVVDSWRGSVPRPMKKGPGVSGGLTWPGCRTWPA